MNKIKFAYLKQEDEYHILTKEIKFPFVKQFEVHVLSKKYNLPVELTHEILSYCFYDSKIVLYNAYQLHKTIMYDILSHIKRGNFSRREDDENNIIDNSGMWTICLDRYNNYDDNEQQLQAINCIWCGNYIVTHTIEKIHVTEYLYLNYLRKLNDIQNNEIALCAIHHFYKKNIPINLRCKCL
jgi:hypothetical protein